MPISYRLLAYLLLTALLPACTSPGGAADPGGPAAATPYRELLVVGIAPGPRLGQNFEKVFVDAVHTQGIKAVAAHREIPGGRRLDGKKVQLAVRRLGSDAVVVTRLTTRDATEVYHPPQVATRPGAYGNLASCCGYRTVSVREPGYTAKHRVLSLETYLYDTSKGQLVWSARSVRLDPASEEKAVRDSVATVTAQMRQAGWLP
jgi:hypothetical protein